VRSLKFLTLIVKIRSTNGITFVFVGLGKSKDLKKIFKPKGLKT